MRLILNITRAKGHVHIPFTRRRLFPKTMSISDSYPPYWYGYAYAINTKWILIYVWFSAGYSVLHRYPLGCAAIVTYWLRRCHQIRAVKWIPFVFGGSMVHFPTKFSPKIAMVSAVVIERDSFSQFLCKSSTEPLNLAKRPA